ncbi:hypothetical protein [Granulicella sp. S190]|uniref:hypothetical protein n=1 Tax=Granulicella sp. S190 TaxID=1747226 RepID=UPI00131E03F6|nr:hypothetical protein [Granulicella sp. S190]
MSLLPLRRAESLQTFSLFWLPARFSTMPDGQKEWLIVFFKHLDQKIAEDLELAKLLFLHEQTLRGNNELKEHFYKRLHRYAPVPGPSRSLTQPPRAKMGPGDMKKFANNRKNPSIDPYMTEVAFRFLHDGAADFTKVFMGYGGMTIVYCGDASEEMMPPMQVPAMPKVAVPKFLQKHTLLKTMIEDFEPARPSAMPGFLRNHPAMQVLSTGLGVDLNSGNSSIHLDTFGKKSKDVFGKAIEDSAGFEGLPFILPRLSSSDFLAQAEEEVRTWFGVFDIYIRECPEDEGIVIASKHNLRQMFKEIIASMRVDGYQYWEG